MSAAEFQQWGGKGREGYEYIQALWRINFFFYFFFILLPFCFWSLRAAQVVLLFLGSECLLFFKHRVLTQTRERGERRGEWLCYNCFSAVVKRRGGGNQTTNHGLLHLSSTCLMAWKACLQCIVPEVPLSPVALPTVQPVGLAWLPARPPPGWCWLWGSVRSPNTRVSAEASSQARVLLPVYMSHGGGARGLHQCQRALNPQEL